MEFSKKSIKQIILLITVGMLLYWCIFNTEQLKSLLSVVMSVLSPIILGAGIAFVIDQVLKPLERFWVWIWRKKSCNITNKLKRPVCLILSTVLIIGLVFAMIFIILPDLRDTFSSLLDNSSTYLDTLTGWWENLNDFADKYGVTLPEISIDSEKVVSTVRNFVKKSGSAIFNKTLGFTISVFSSIVNFILALAFSMYILAQKEKFKEQYYRIIKALFKEERAKRIYDITQMINRSFSSFVSGQCVEAVIIGLLCFVGMLIFRFPYASVVSIMVGFTALIPVVGAFIGTAVGAFLILMVKPIKALWFIIFILVLQQVEGNLIYPKVVGKSIGLPGIWVLAAITIGGEVGGIIGMLLGVPICSVLLQLANEYIDKKLETRGRLE